MKHNWTRPIVKFIEDDIVASGIGGATGPARFFAARGAGLVGDGVNKTWGSGDTRTWSAWDNMFVQKQGYKRRRIIPTKRKFTQLRRKRYVRRRVTRYARKKSSWGTRVRRAALRSHESKRHQITTTEELIDDATLDVTAICRVPDLDQAGTQGLTSKVTRNGSTIIGTGIASKIHLRNETTQPMMVKLIWYYKTGRDTNQQQLFRGDQYENLQDLSDPTSYFGKMIQTLGNANTRILKSLTVTLSEKELGTMGTDVKMLKVWIPFKKVIKFNLTDEGNQNQTYDVHFALVPFNKEGTPFTTGSGDGTENVLHAQHRHIFYYRDP